MNAQQVLEQIDFYYGSPLNVFSECTRGFLIAAPGKDLIAADLANIESRSLAWQAGEEWKLEAFRAYDEGKGPDLYRLMAARIYEIPLEKVTKDQRQIGKVAELACGYQGGVGAFQMMAKTYLVKVPDSVAETAKATWRALNPKIVAYWPALERAVISAVKCPGEKFKAGAAGREVSFLKKGSFLWCRLPSGRVICYPYPRVDLVKTPWGEMKEALTYMTTDVYVEDPKTGIVTKVRWGRTSTYGGSLAQNITEAECRDLLADAMVRLEELDYPVVIHVHDEAVGEVPEDYGSVEEMEGIIELGSSWAKDLPIAAEGWRGKRYRKA